MQHETQEAASRTLNVLYISSRINAPDGSSVHGRAFHRNVAKLGHEIRTFPAIEPIRYIQDKSAGDQRSRLEKLRQAGLSSVIKSRVRKLGRFASDLVDLYDGLADTVRYFLGVREILKDFSPDVMVCRATVFNFAPQLIRRIYRLPCVSEVNSIKYLEISVASRNGAAARLTRWAEQFAINHSDRVFVVSQPIKDFVDGFYPPEHCSVIPNGVETDDFDPARFDKNALKEQLGIKDRIVLGYVGSYKAWHGIPTSVELIQQLYRKNPRYMLLLIGNGEQYGEIKSSIASKGLQDMVKQIDYVPHEDVPRYTAVFDYAVMTYPDFEGFYFSPLKMYEYMSMGTPVVSTNTGQIGTIIRSGETGELVYPPTVDNFAEAIESLQNSADKYQAVSTAARTEVLRHHSWLGNASQVISVCEELLEKAGGSAGHVEDLKT